MEPYRSFKVPAEADFLAEWLAEQGIHVITKEVQPMANASFLATKFTKDYQVLIPAEDFAKADDLLATYYREQLDTLDKDYYLFSFSDQELMEIIEMPDKWGELDYVLAKELLKQRGQEVSDYHLEKMKQTRMKELTLPEKNGTVPVIVGWAFVILAALATLWAIPAFEVGCFALSVSGLFGMFIGWHLSNDSKIIPDGGKSFVYSLTDRKKGRWLRYVGTVWLVVAIVLLVGTGYVNSFK
jgi:hypothetical protein